MSTWISKVRFAVAPVLFLSLAACLEDGAGGAGGVGFVSQPGATETDGAVLREVTLFGGGVVVAGPKGYCIDGTSLRRGGGGAFVLIASCESLTGKMLAMEVNPAVMTVTVLPKQPGAAQPTTADLADMVRTGKVLAADDGDGLALVHLSDGGDAFLPEGDPRHWRGGMLINGHVVGLAVYSPKGEAPAGLLGRNILMALAETLRSRSPVRSFAPAAQQGG